MWKVDTPIDKAQVKVKSNKNFGILDYLVTGSGGNSWPVYCRVIKNGEGAIVSSIFVRPEILSKTEFESVIKPRISRRSNYYSIFDF